MTNNHQTELTLLRSATKHNNIHTIIVNIVCLYRYELNEEIVYIDAMVATYDVIAFLIEKLHIF